MPIELKMLKNSMHPFLPQFDKCLRELFWMSDIWHFVCSSQFLRCLHSKLQKWATPAMFT
jgi:hypothetical protein